MSTTAQRRKIASIKRAADVDHVAAQLLPEQLPKGVDLLRLEEMIAWLIAAKIPALLAREIVIDAVWIGDATHP